MVGLTLSLMNTIYVKRKTITLPPHPLQLLFSYSQPSFECQVSKHPSVTLCQSFNQSQLTRDRELSTYLLLWAGFQHKIMIRFFLEKQGYMRFCSLSVNIHVFCLHAHMRVSIHVLLSMYSMYNVFLWWVYTVCYIYTMCVVVYCSHTSTDVTLRCFIF